jgi:hypothetical protein
VYQTYKHTGPDKYGFGGILGRKGGPGANGNRDKDGFERLDTTGSDGEDDLFVSSRMVRPPGSSAGSAASRSHADRMKFSLDEDDGSSSDSDAEVFSRHGSFSKA